VLNYWNCLCVSHKLNYLLLFSYTTCCQFAMLASCFVTDLTKITQVLVV